MWEQERLLKRDGFDYRDEMDPVEEIPGRNSKSRGVEEVRFLCRAVQCGWRLGE